MIEPTRFDPPPAYQHKPFSSSAYGPENDSLRQRQEELEKKAAELERKEEELKRVQSNIERKNNFPPLPKFFCVQPCFYHDITVEIPVESQRTCKMLFYLWQLYIFTLFFNFISALAYIAISPSNGTTTFVLSIIYLIVLTPCSFVCWYRPIYKALKSDSSFSYMLFFFVFFFQILVNVLYALGVGGFGTCGWINASAELDNSAVVGGMMFVCATLWTLLIVFEILLLRKVHSSYRQSGASLEKAQGEFARGVASNKNVQSAAAEAVRGGIEANTRH